MTSTKNDVYNKISLTIMTSYRIKCLLCTCDWVATRGAVPAEGHNMTMIGSHHQEGVGGGDGRSNVHGVIQHGNFFQRAAGVVVVVGVVYPASYTSKQFISALGQCIINWAIA